MVKHLLPGVFAVGLLAACAGVADLDVNYTGGATTTTEDGGGTVTPGADASDAPPFVAHGDAGDTSELGQQGSACPCDSSQGLACCVSAGGATCTTDQAGCQAQTGAFLRCFGPDPEGSFCCAHHETGAVQTALAAECRPGTSIVCTIDTDCPNGKCTIGSCGGARIGTCDGTPVCP